jgi:hypothetical protein
MEKLFAALIPVLCVVAFGPLFCQSMDTVVHGESACEAPGDGSGPNQSKAPLCEVTR